MWPAHAGVAAAPCHRCVLYRCFRGERTRFGRAPAEEGLGIFVQISADRFEEGLCGRGHRVVATQQHAGWPRRSGHREVQPPQGAATRAAGLAAKAWQCFGVDKAVQRESIVVLERFDLVEIMNERTRDLPYGKQRLLEIALAIACKARLLLLDEPAAGVPESDRADIVNALRKLPDDVSILLVEHDMDLVFSFATHIWVLAFGQLIVSGSVEQISSDPKVRRIYLGQDDDDD